MTILHTIGSFIGGLFFAVGSWFAPVHVVQAPPQNKLGSQGIIVNIAAFFDSYLSGAISASQTTLTLGSNKTAAGTTLANGYYSFIIDQNIPNQTEIVEGNVSGTALTGLLRGVDPQNPNVTSTALAFSHLSGADIRVTDYSAFGHITRILSGLDTLPAILSYDSTTNTSTLTSNLLNIPTVGYVNSVASSGAPNADTITKGILQLATSTQVASGTVLGSTGASLVVPNSFFRSTSSPSVLVPVTDANGKIDSGFIKQSDNYTWSGNNSYTGTSTFSASFRTTGSSTIGAAGVTTTFSGTIVGLPFSQILDSTSSAVTVGNTTATTTLISIPIPANTLVGINAVRVHIYFSTLHETNGAAQVGHFTMTYASNTVATLNITGGGGGSNTRGYLDMILQAKASSSAQYGTLFINAISSNPSASGTLDAVSSFAGWLGTVTGSATSGATTTQNLVLLIKHEVADSNNTVTMDSYVAEKIINQ